MTKDDVIKLAQEVGIEDGNIPALAWGRLETGIELLTYFANAVEAKYRESLLAGAGKPQIIGVAGFCDDGVGYTADQLAAAVLREREECAKVCDEVGGRVSDSHAWDAAAAIRARGNKT